LVGVVLFQDKSSMSPLPLFITYEITTWPVADRVQYLSASLEGRLVLRLPSGDEIVIPRVLLVECAIHVDRWLRGADQGLDLFYRSMDVERQPILGLDWEPGSRSYRPWSALVEIPSVLIPQAELTAAVRRFILALDRELGARLGVDLLGLLRDRGRPFSGPRKP
jgi:hypothetical protein